MWPTPKHSAKLHSLKRTFTTKKIMVAVVLMLVFIIKATLQYTCTSTSSTEMDLIIQRSTFDSSLKIIAGPISGNLYYLSQDNFNLNTTWTIIVKLKIDY